MRRRSLCSCEATQPPHAHVPRQVFLDLDWSRYGRRPYPQPCGVGGETCTGHFSPFTNYTLYAVAVNAFGAGPVSPPFYVFTGK